jgi:hypothetical protein
MSCSFLGYVEFADLSAEITPDSGVRLESSGSFQFGLRCRESSLQNGESGVYRQDTWQPFVHRGKRGSLVSALPIPIGDEFITAVAQLFILPSTVVRIFDVVNCQM